MLIGLCHFFLASLKVSPVLGERFPTQSVKGIKEDWVRLDTSCYRLLVRDVGNSDLFDIQSILQRTIRDCKLLLTRASHLSMEDIKQCDNSIHKIYLKCKETSKYPEHPDFSETPEEVRLVKSPSKID